MWKDADFYSKRDDDSAIGDSENNSAEEGSMNSRRKSSISDDLDEMSMDAHVQIQTKLDQKIPECLLKSSDELIENCRKIQKSYANIKPAAKREIRVLPSAAAVVRRKVSTEAIKPSSKENSSVLEAKFQFLLSEMKKVREMDQEILKTFLQLNESVEEVRWKLIENEEDLKRKMAEEEEEDLSSDFFFEQGFTNFDVMPPLSTYASKTVTSLPNDDVTYASTNHENVEISRTITNHDSVSAMTPYENAGIIKSMTKSTSSPAVSLRHIPANNNKVSTNKILSTGQLTATSHSSPVVPANTKPQHSSTLLSHSVDSTSELHEQSILTTPEPRQTSKQKAAVSNKENSNRESPSDIWIVREDFKTVRSERTSRKNVTRNSIAISPVVGINHSTPPRSEGARRRKSEVAQPPFRGRSNLGACSFRMVADENSRIGRLAQAQWNTGEQKVDSKAKPISSQTQSSNLHAVGLARLRGHAAHFTPGIAKSSDSSNSLNSSSSRTSSESSNSAPPPPSNPLKRSNSSSKWGRLFRRTSKSGISGVEKKQNGVVLNNNHKPPPKGMKRISEPVLTETSIVPVSFKTTPDNLSRWTHNHDDITYL